MKTKITILLLATVSLLFNVNTANAQTCGTSQVTYSGYTSNFLPKWNTTTGCISNSIIYDSGDRIGFGLTAPASLLHSAGQIRTGIPYGGLGGAAAITGALLFYNSSNTNTVNIQSGATTTSYSMTLPPAQGAASSVLMNNGSGGLDWAQLNVGFWGLTGNTLTGTLPASPAEFIGTVNAADWIIRTNNTEKMRVLSGGNVGIGTTSPYGQLTVAGAGQASTSFSTSGSYLSSIVAGDITGGTGNGGALLFAAGSGVWANNGVFAAIKSSVTNGTGPFGDIQFCTRTTANNATTTLDPKMTILGGGNVGIGITNPAYKLDVTGDIHNTGVMAVGMAPSGTYALTINGSGLAFGGSWTPSDQQFKTNIDSLHNALTTINQLKPKSYYFDTANVYGLNFSNKKQYGFIAQDVETILPELIISTTKPADVDTSGNIIHPAVTYKALNYNAFFGILTKGIQELKQKNDSLETINDVQDSVNNSLQNQLNQLTINANNQDSINNSLQDQLNQLLNCCNDNENNSMQSNNNTKSKTSKNSPESILQEPTKRIDIELNDAQSIVLEQNVPNPFAEQTTINYYLPDNTIKAQMLFYNAQGKLIQSVELMQKGKGQLNVFASDLSNGIYTYTLVVDGKVVETKKMIKQ